MIRNKLKKRRCQTYKVTHKYHLEKTNKPDMTAVFHSRLYIRLLEIMSNISGKELY